jgi:signal transduction histidine kinase
VSEELIQMEVIDDGRGISQHIVKELESNPSYSVSGGGTGLFASKNAVESLGGNFQIGALPEQKGSRVVVQFCTYLG